MIQSFLLYIKKLTGYYQWEDVHVCPLCNAQEFEPYSKYRYGLLTLRLQSCRQCNLVVLSPRLIEKSLEKLYQTENHSRLKKKINLYHCENLFQRGFRRGAYICKFLDENGIKYRDSVVFEVGCSYGGILEQFRGQGCHVKGCDLRPTAVQYGISKGLDIEVGSVNILENLNYKADLVILSHVLEHIAEPNSFLRRIRQILKPEGFLYVEVPGIENTKFKKKRYTQLTHLIYFNQDTIRKMVEKIGFCLLFGNEVVQSVFSRN